MREILFRGKSNDNGEWVCGDLIQNRFKRGIYIEFYDKSCIPAKHILEQIIPDTVGQYTGLEDKNFKMIFEGDIVEYHEGIAKITWEETEALFGIKQDNDVRDFNSYWGQDLEVIGNIHDNPELLKGEE